MAAIDQISWRKFEKFLFKIGCSFKRQKGDHRIYWKAGILRPLVVPQERVLPVFIILNNLRVLGIPKEDFLEIMNKL
jgi:predicted RNA binding protein YcfA (HicA-like mRNA interferase family)